MKNTLKKLVEKDGLKAPNKKENVTIKVICNQKKY